MNRNTRLSTFLNKESLLTVKNKVSGIFKLSESPKAFAVIAAGGVSILIAANIISAATRSSAKADNYEPIAAGKEVSEALAAANAPLTPEAITPPPPEIETYSLKRRETLIEMLDRAGIASRDAYSAVNTLGTITDLRKLRPDQTFKLTRSQNDKTKLQELALRDAFANEAVVTWDDQQFLAVDRAVQTLPVTRYVEGEITDSLYLSAKRAGVPEKTIIELIRLMSFDVDFQRDIRKGDLFAIYFEREYAPDFDDVDEGTILKASLTLRGQELEAIYYEDEAGDTGYYGADGKSTQKALMKTPVEGARLSSSFGRRKHPILGYTRLHKGLDFAAPRGTPIMAAGNGTIEMATRNGSFGNYVRIRHGNSYKTAYAHLKSYGRGIKKGVKVKQGQIIGYIGTTGRSTGPHLHYEVLLSGKQVDPRKLKLPTARTLKAGDLDKFQNMRDRYVAEIDQIKSSLAALDTPDSVAVAEVAGS